MRVRGAERGARARLTPAPAPATLRLWNIQSGQTERRFVSHTKDVLSVAFSSDNRQICSAGRDGTIKLWNTLGECKYTITQGGPHEPLCPRGRRCSDAD